MPPTLTTNFPPSSHPAGVTEASAPAPAGSGRASYLRLGLSGGCAQQKKKIKLQDSRFLYCHMYNGMLNPESLLQYSSKQILNNSKQLVMKEKARSTEKFF